MSSPPLAAGNLDRDAATRTSETGLERAWQRSDARVLRLHGALIPVVVEGESRARLALGPTQGHFAAERDGHRVGHCYLGAAGGAPVFAEAATEHPADSEEGPVESGSSAVAATGVPGSVWRHPFETMMDLDETEREMIAVASALLRWHESSVFSSRDGGATAPMLGGWGRRDEHGGEHFPRTDPAVIVLIEHEGRVLLGSNALWESGRFSLLAGFVEAGESAEQTVVREVFEEAGIPIGDIRYVTSQPWPFPRSLMLGFRARLVPGTDPDALVPDPAEISELRWFTRDELRAPAPGIKLPMPVSIARWLIDQWVAEGDGTA